MSKYECYNCGYTNNHKAKMRNHLNRKNKCKCLNGNDINLEECYEYILEGMSYNDYVNKMNKKNKIHDINLNCTYCNKILTHKSSIYNHHKICKEKIKIDTLEAHYKTQINNHKIQYNILEELCHKQKMDYKQQLAITKNNYQEQLEDYKKHFNDKLSSKIF